MTGRQWSGWTYRFGFNGKENDDEVKGDGNHQDYGMRIYDSRLGRFLSVDPMASDFVWNSPYAFAENDILRCIDLEGKEKWIVTISNTDNGNLQINLALTSLDVTDGIQVSFDNGMSYSKDLQYYKLFEYLSTRFEYEKTMISHLDYEGFIDFYKKAEPNRSISYNTYQHSDGKEYPLPEFSWAFEISESESLIPHYIERQKNEYGRGMIIGSKSSSISIDNAISDIRNVVKAASPTNDVNNNLKIVSQNADDLIKLTRAAKEAGFELIESEIDNSLEPGESHLIPFKVVTTKELNTGQQTVDN